MIKAYKEIMGYAKKYPWLYLALVISSISLFLLNYYEKIQTGDFLVGPLYFLMFFIISVFFFIISVLILTLVTKYVLDKYFKVGTKGYVSFPLFIFVLSIPLTIFTGWTYYQKAFVDLTVFGIMKPVYVWRFYNSIFFLIVNSLLYLKYRK